MEIQTKTVKPGTVDVGIFGTDQEQREANQWGFRLPSLPAISELRGGELKGVTFDTHVRWTGGGDPLYHVRVRFQGGLTPQETTQLVKGIEDFAKKSGIKKRAASLHASILRIASDLPQGDPTRRKLLAALRREMGGV